MNHPSTSEETFEKPFLLFLTSLQKVVATQFLLVFFACLSLCLTGVSMVSGAEYLSATGIALSILLGLTSILSSAYFYDLMRKKSLSTCQSIAQNITLKHPQDPEAIAKSLTRYAQEMSLKELNLIAPNHTPKALEALCTQCISFFAWKYLHNFTEVLFLAALDYTISYAKAFPLLPEAHASLANCYVMLANSYKNPLLVSPHLPWPGLWITTDEHNLLVAKSQNAAKAAVEELSILKTFSPDELWVHDQLAISYKELKMPQEEISECEEIIRLCPDDENAQLRLGILYFQLGQNGKGLIIYERLKAIHPSLADELIAHYGSYQPFLQFS